MIRKGRGRSGWPRAVLAVCCIAFVMVFIVIAARVLESRMNIKIKDAGQQLTSHTQSLDTAQVFMNEKWYAERNMQTLLVMGIDNDGKLEGSESYSGMHQTDFLVLYLRDVDTGYMAAIHLNRDTMTDITTLGVTGQPTGTRYAQLALAYNYGGGDHISSRNVADAVQHLLYGMEIDHYITVTMDAVPIINDWAGGVTLEVKDDFTGIDDSLVQGSFVKLQGDTALTYVRTRKGLDDSSNLRRMERQRQYASEWVKSAQSKLNDVQAVADLVLQMDGYYQSNCTVEELKDYLQNLSGNPSIPTYEIEGEAVQGEEFMEFHVNESALQQLVLSLFYAPVVE